MKILYITSFSETLFKASGHNMINSFIQHKIEGDLFVGYESFNFSQYITSESHPNILSSDIMEYDFLKDWIQNNKDVIPVIFGGNMKPTSDGPPPDGNKILQNKVYTYWNKKASLWFRKVATMLFALNKYGELYDCIVWVDCDCLFLKQLPSAIIENIFKISDVFYHQGQYRNLKDFGFETGLIGFKKGAGYDIIKDVCNMYQTRKYIDLNRWDDGYVFKIIIQKLTNKNKIKSIDLVDNGKKGKRLDAINKGLFVEFVIHNKGMHKKLPNLG